MALSRTVPGVTVLRVLGRGLVFTGKYLLAVLMMLLIAALQAPAVLWYVTAATPACGAAADPALLTGAKVGLIALGLASAAVAVVLGVRFLRLRWGWLLWWVVPVAALAAPAATWHFLPTLVPGTGGLFCH